MGSILLVIEIPSPAYPRRQEESLATRRRSLIATYCHHSILYRRYREAAVAPDLTFQSDSCQYKSDSCQYNQNLKLIRIASHKLIKVHFYFMS